MKKTTIGLLLFVSAGITAFSQAIPNFSFENFHTETQTPHNYVVPVSWSTSDMAANDFTPTYSGSSVTITPTSYLGSFAVLMQTAANSGDTVAGAVYSVDSVALIIDNLLGANYGLGFPCNARPASLQGYYKFTGVGNDSIEFIIALTAWDNVHHGRDTVAYVNSYFGQMAGTYTLINVPITYRINNIVPDTALIATGIVGPNGAKSHIGTQYYLDDLSFNGSVPLGVNSVTQTDANVRLYPNPFTDRAILAVSNVVTLSGATLEITNVLGQTVRTIQNINANTIPIERADLQSGMYFYRLINKQNLVSTGKLVIE
jgi:hypothetical protein